MRREYDLKVGWKLRKFEGKPLTGYYPDASGWYQKWDEEVAPFVFTATLRVISMERGRSAAFFHVTDVDDNGKYQTNMVGMLEIMTRLQDGRMTLDRGAVRGLWQFTKRGTNAFVEPVLEKS